MTNEKKIKVSELPEEEQKALISEAMSLGIHGILTGWGVETLKNKIEPKKAIILKPNKLHLKRKSKTATVNNKPRSKATNKATANKPNLNNKRTRNFPTTWTTKQKIF